MWHLVVTLILFYCGAFQHYEAALAQLFEECIGIEDSGTYVASQSSCEKYIYCDGSNSFEAACFEDNFYDAERERCVDQESYKCKLNGSNDKENSKENDDRDGDDEKVKEPPVKIPGSKTTTAISPIPVKPQQQQKQNQTNNTATIEIPPPIVGITPSETLDLGSFACLATTENNRNGTMHYQLANPASCTSYFLCYNGISIAMSCARGMYFNRLSGRCAPAETVTCVWPQRPIAVRSECREGIYDFMPHDSKCEYFYYCSNGYAMIHRCPLEYTWHYERRTCVHQTQSKCFNNNNNALPYVAT